MLEEHCINICNEIFSSRIIPPRLFYWRLKVKHLLIRANAVKHSAVVVIVGGVLTAWRWAKYFGRTPYQIKDKNVIIKTWNKMHTILYWVCFLSFLYFVFGVLRGFVLGGYAMDFRWTAFRIRRCVIRFDDIGLNLRTLCDYCASNNDNRTIGISESRFLHDITRDMRVAYVQILIFCTIAILYRVI